LNSKNTKTVTVHAAQSILHANLPDKPTSPSPSTFQNVAFINPDGSMVLVASSAGRKSQAFSVQMGLQSFQVELPAASVGTYLWK